MDQVGKPEPTGSAEPGSFTRPGEESTLGVPLSANRTRLSVLYVDIKIKGIPFRGSLESPYPLTNEWLKNFRSNFFVKVVEAWAKKNDVEILVYLVPEFQLKLGAGK